MTATEVLMATCVGRPLWAAGEIERLSRELTAERAETQRLRREVERLRARCGDAFMRGANDGEPDIEWTEA